MAGDELLNSLEQAVAGDPTNAALRAHLAEMYCAAGDYEPALRHAEEVLAQAPDHILALMTAATAAEHLGSPRSASYRRLADALVASIEEPAATPSEVAPDSPSEVPSVDDLIELWDSSEAPPDIEVGEMEAPGISLADVGGMDDVKERLELSFLGPLRNPEISSQFGKTLRGGLLLWGPPGCGKTFLARACAGELGASFYSVGLSDILDIYIGSSERNLTSIFEIARRNAPCVLFFDEMDALGMKRTQLRGGGGLMRGVVNQFLTELDGVGKDNDGVFVLGATNHPWDVDTALLRPGRFDRRMLVLPPDEAARVKILEYHLRGRPQKVLDLAKVAKKTEGFSGADLALLCEGAAERALADSLKAAEIRPIEMGDVRRALKDTHSSTGAWLETARNYAMYSNEDGQLDELLDYLKRR